MATNPMDHSLLMQLLSDEAGCAESLRTYFRGYTGGHFETLGGRGDADEVRDRIIPADLLAVQCLSVSVPMPVAIELLDGSLGEQLNGLLENIPTELNLGGDGARLLVGDGSKADEAWYLLEAQDDVGWVTAGKLLARKRPRLVPVWDAIVRCAYGRPRGNQWVWLHDLLAADDEAALKQLAAVREKAGLSEQQTSLLRTLDIVVWMLHRPRHSKVRCGGLREQLAAADAT
jgi:hypothetical protein